MEQVTEKPTPEMGFRSVKVYKMYLSRQISAWTQQRLRNIWQKIKLTDWKWEVSKYALSFQDCNTGNIY